MEPNQKVKLAVAGVLLLIAVGLLLARSGEQGRLRGAPIPDNQYFYDLQTGELFEAAADQIPPITAPSGGEGVQAFVYTCGSCMESELIIGYVQTLNEKAAQLAKQTEGLEADFSANQQIEQGTFVAPKPDPGTKPNWVSLSLTQGQEVTQAFRNLCADKLARICHPN